MLRKNKLVTSSSMHINTPILVTIFPLHTHLQIGAKTFGLKYQPPNSSWEEKPSRLAYCIPKWRCAGYQVWRRKHVLNPKEQIQALRTGEVWKPRYPSKKSPTADPKLNPEPATKLTGQLAAGTVHGCAPIHSLSANPRTNRGPAWG